MVYTLVDYLVVEKVLVLDSRTAEQLVVVMDSDWAALLAIKTAALMVP